MRIKRLSISNVMSFKYCNDIKKATSLDFDEKMNIVIGENGAGKSTAMEALNFIFKKVFFLSVRYDYSDYNNYNSERRKSTLVVEKEKGYKEVFRLEPNWKFTNDEQKIYLEFYLDSVDKKNIAFLSNNKQLLDELAKEYSNETLPDFKNNVSLRTKYNVTVTLKDKENTFEFSHNLPDDTMFYLQYYEFLNELIRIANDKRNARLKLLSDTFMLLSAFRNYNAYNSQLSLSTQNPIEQFRQLHNQKYFKNTNFHDSGEPEIFSIVKLRLSEKYLKGIIDKKTIDKCQHSVNELKFMQNINEKLKIINLECIFKLKDLRTWNFEFIFRDRSHNKELGDINSLSAGQKSILHLIFEAYGRDDLNGGVIIIDEPEIHLHYQFQSEYVRILEEICENKTIQYILVTHSDSLINTKTIDYVKRFSLDGQRFTAINSLKDNNNNCKNIIENTQSARALFTKKVLLVEGQDDRYFFSSILNKLHPEARNDIYIFSIDGKPNYNKWKEFYESCGLRVCAVLDLDAMYKIVYNAKDKELNLNKNPTAVSDFYKKFSDARDKIEEKRKSGLFFLSHGVLENYYQRERVLNEEKIKKGLEYVIEFCNNQLDNFLKEKTVEAKDIVEIIKLIVNYE